MTRAIIIIISYKLRPMIDPKSTIEISNNASSSHWEGFAGLQLIVFFSRPRADE